MAARRRLGVALLVDPPLATEIDGLRRALGDPNLARIAPHITLVPPVNVRAEALPDALAVLRAAAGRCAAPLTLHLGPPTSFLPVNPVVHLDVGGDLPELRRLRDAVFAPPLARELSWPWVPHLTLTEGLEPPRIDAAVAALTGYQVVTRADRVVLLELRPEPGGRRWVPLADAALAPAAVVGRGGLELTMVEGRVIGPDVAALFPPEADLPSPGRVVAVVSGLADGGLAGVAVLVDRGAGDRWAAVIVDPDRRGCGFGRALLERLRLAAEAAGVGPTVTGVGPAGFYQACGHWAAPVSSRP